MAAAAIFNFDFLAIFQSPLQLFSSNLVHLWIIITVIGARYATFGDLQDGVGRHLEFRFLPMSLS